MSDKIAAMQEYLNARGHKPQLVVDGVPGPATRQAIFDTFRNRAATAVTDQDMRRFADRLQVTPRQIRAVASVESGGSGWDSAGMLKCLWERHYAFKRFQILVPLLSNPAPGGYTIDADGDGTNDSWEKVADAALTFREPAKAFECASFGMFQIMGAWWQKLGYSSSVDFVWQLSRSEAAQYDALLRYVERFGLLDAIRKIDGNPMNCLDFARGYNGKAQRGYDAKIAAAFRVGS